MIRVLLQFGRIWPKLVEILIFVFFQNVLTAAFKTLKNPSIFVGIKTLSEVFKTFPATSGWNKDRNLPLPSLLSLLSPKSRICHKSQKSQSIRKDFFTPRCKNSNKNPFFVMKSVITFSIFTKLKSRICKIQ